MSTPVKTGIIGFGRVAGNHLKQLKEQEGCFDVRAVCDMNEARRAAAEEEGVPFTTDDIGEFLRQDLELVLITTHSSAHYEPAKACLEAGKNIVVEKPVTVRAAEAEELFALAADKGLTMLVHHNRRFDADYQQVKKLVQDQGIGEFVLVENRVGGSRPAVGFGVPEFNQQWRITKAMGGGTLMDFGPHYTDQVLDLLPGKITGLFADVRRVKWGDADDYFNILLVFENNARAVISKADFVYAAHPKWLVYGSEATVWEDAEKKTHWKKDDDEVIAEPFATQPSLHRNYYEVIREGAEPLIDPKGSLRVARVLDAAMVSAEKGEFLKVDI